MSSGISMLPALLFDFLAGFSYREPEDPLLPEEPRPDEKRTSEEQEATNTAQSINTAKRPRHFALYLLARATNAPDQFQK